MGACADSTWTCDVSGQKVCNPKMGTTETCNGIDDDCNGKTDDIAAAACSPAIPADIANCQVGFVTGGHKVCENGNLVCRAVPATDFCGSCGVTASGLDCGVCGATPCTPGVSKCIPSFVCAGSGTATCNVDVSCTNMTPQCWHPSDTHAGANCYTP